MDSMDENDESEADLKRRRRRNHTFTWELKKVGSDSATEIIIALCSRELQNSLLFFCFLFKGLLF